MNQQTRRWRGGRDIEYYQFQQDACACFFNYDILEGEVKPELMLDVYFTGATNSPFVPGQFNLQCQINEIYNHGLGPDCNNEIANIPYDYTDCLEANDSALPKRAGYI